LLEYNLYIQENVNKYPENSKKKRKLTRRAQTTRLSPCPLLAGSAGCGGVVVVVRVAEVVVVVVDVVVVVCGRGRGRGRVVVVVVVCDELAVTCDV
jgi:hypothetical protein